MRIERIIQSSVGLMKCEVFHKIEYKKEKERKRIPVLSKAHPASTHTG
jgi:hypothetical protein